MIIKVTKNDIKNGTRRCCDCPVALAIRHALNGLEVTVGAGHVFVGPRQFVLPRSAQRFIRRFDNRLPVEPFSFKVAL